MKTIEMNGKTIEVALQNALAMLNVTEDKVTYEVIDSGNKGFFGIGSRPSSIKVTLKKDYVNDAKSFLSETLNKMNINAEINVVEDGTTLRIDLVGAQMGILIGYRGETLDSLQYLTSLVINKENRGDYRRVVVDTESYRAKREETLRQLAFKMARNVVKNKRAIKLEPMNPYERRIIHSALQNDRFISTFSEGDEPYRRVVLDLKKA